MQRNRQGPGQDLLDHIRLVKFFVEYQHIVEALTDFYFGRKNEIWEEKLDPRAVFHSKIGRCDLHETRCLPSPRIRGDVKGIFHAADDEEPKIVVRRRFIARMKRQFHKNGFDAPVDDARRAGQRIFQIMLCERKCRQKAEVEIFTNLQIGDDAEVETGPRDRFDPRKRIAPNEIL